MKKILLFIGLAITLAGCSKDINISNDYPEDDYDKNGINTNMNKKESFTFDRYYTNLSVFPDSIKIIQTPYINIKYNEGETTSVSWTYNDINIANNAHSDWNGYEQKWHSNNTPAFEYDTYYKFGDKFKASIKLPNGTEVSYEKTVMENKITRDILDVNFGMTKQDVINELGLSSSSEYMPNTLAKRGTANLKDGTTIYRFKDNKLIEVGEYITPIGFIDKDDIKILNSIVIEYCKSIGLTEEPEIDPDRYLAKEYIWNKENIILTLSIANDVPIFDREGLIYHPSIGVSYKLR